MRNLKTLATCVATLAFLAACGGGSDDPADTGGNNTGGNNSGGNNSGGNNVTLTCDTTHYQAGTVEVPTAAQLGGYAGTFAGEEGEFGPNPGDPFVKSADATLVLGADGKVTYKGTAYTVKSACVDKTAGTYGKILYIEAGNGGFDMSTQNNPGLGWAWGSSPVDGVTMFRNGIKQ